MNTNIKRILTSILAFVMVFTSVFTMPGVGVEAVQADSGKALYIIDYDSNGGFFTLDDFKKFHTTNLYNLCQEYAKVDVYANTRSNDYVEQKVLESIHFTNESDSSFLSDDIWEAAYTGNGSLLSYWSVLLNTSADYDCIVYCMPDFNPGEFNNLTANSLLTVNSESVKYTSRMLTAMNNVGCLQSLGRYIIYSNTWGDTFMDSPWQELYELSQDASHNMDTGYSSMRTRGAMVDATFTPYIYYNYLVNGDNGIYFKDNLPVNSVMVGSSWAPYVVPIKPYTLSSYDHTFNFYFETEDGTPVAKNILNTNREIIAEGVTSYTTGFNDADISTVTADLGAVVMIFDSNDVVIDGIKYGYNYKYNYIEASPENILLKDTSLSIPTLTRSGGTGEYDMMAWLPKTDASDWPDEEYNIHIVYVPSGDTMFDKGLNVANALRKFSLEDRTTVKGIEFWEDADMWMFAGYIQECFPDAGWTNTPSQGKAFIEEAIEKGKVVKVSASDSAYPIYATIAEETCTFWSLATTKDKPVYLNPDSSQFFYGVFPKVQDFSDWTRQVDSSKVTNMSSMFSANAGYNTPRNTTANIKIDVSNWDTSNVTNMSYAFYYLRVKDLDLSNWDTRNVTNMYYAFAPGGWVIKSLTLGENFRFVKEQNGTPLSPGLIGYWYKDGTTTSYPATGASTQIENSFEDTFNSDPTNMAGTWLQGNPESHYWLLTGAGMYEVHHPEVKYSAYCMGNHIGGGRSEFERILVDDPAILKEFTGPQKTNSAPFGSNLREAFIALMYYGYPNDPTGIQAKYGLTNSQFQVVTQLLVWYCSDGWNYLNTNYLAKNADGTWALSNRFGNVTEEVMQNIQKAHNELRDTARFSTIPNNENLHLYAYYSVGGNQHRITMNSVASDVYGGVEIKKEDLEGNPLQGAEFTIYDETGAVVETIKSNNKGLAFACSEDDTDGLIPGTYTVKETKAPEGYIKSDDVFEFTVEAGQITGIGYKNGGELKEEILFVNDGNPGGGLKLTKTSSTDSSMVLPGATYGIYQDGELVETIYTDATGSGETANTRLQVGTYQVKEIASPYGFSVDTEAKTVNITTPLTMTELNVTDAPKTGTVTLKAKKVVEGMSKIPAGEFTFELLDEDGHVIQTATNDANGDVTFRPITYSGDKNFDSESYTIREKNDGKSKYEYDDHTEGVYVEIEDNGGDSLETIVYYDTPSGALFTNVAKVSDLEITKTVTGANLDRNKAYEMTVTLTEGDGTKVSGTYDIEGDDSGKITFTNGEAKLYIKAGSRAVIKDIIIGTNYTVTETEDREFTATQKTFSGQITGETNKVAFINNSNYVSMETLKTNKEGTAISDAALAIYEGNTLIKSWLSDQTVEYTYLLPGVEYTLKELKVSDPDMYLLADDITFTINEQGGVIYDGETHDRLTMVDDYTKTVVNVDKEWDDESNRDGVRPNMLIIRLLADGVDTGLTRVLAGYNLYQAAFENLDKYQNNKPIEYTVVEVDPYPYVPSYRRTGDHITITNSYKPKKIDLSGEKIWDDKNDQDGIRPSSINVTLYGDGTALQTAQVTAQNDWKFEFKDLYQYKDGGTEIVYTINEASVGGYEKAIDNFKITNTHVPETTSVSFVKNWLDDGNRDGIRPDSITVTLIKDGVNTGISKIAVPGTYSGTFENLDKYRDGGVEIKYSIVEAGIEGYTSEITGNQYDGYTIYNRHEPELTSVAGTKYWDDNSDQDGKRPEEITVVLYGNGREVDNQLAQKSQGWIYRFDNLLANEDGLPIIYTVNERNVPGYTKQVNGYNITNSYTPGKVNVSFTKEWVDESNRDGIRPDSITVHLYKDGVDTGEEIIATKENNYASEFTGLDEYEEGSLIEWTIKEDAVSGYETEITGSVDEGFKITNTHEVEVTTISGTKTWVDNNNQDGIRPDKITVTLYGNGNKVAEKEVASPWTYEFKDVKKNEAGKEITYTVDESPVTGYTKKIDGLNITNTHTPETITVEVTKVWEDDSNRDGIRPDDITVKLIGGETKTLTLEKGKGYTGEFKDVAKYANGKEITYSLEEVSVDGYTSKITGNQKDGFTVTNTHSVETVAVSGKKTWNDANNQDGKRPSSITVNLFKNGTKIDEKTVQAPWTYEFKDLPAKENGKDVVYTVDESPVSGYSKSVSGYNISNVYTPGKTSVRFEKIWVDDDDRDGMRPDEIKVYLLADGVDTGKSVTATKADNYAGEFTGLDEFKNGKKITYTVEEEAIDGYTSKVEGSDGHFTITNTHEIKLTNITGKKTWVDDNNQDGKRPTSITVILKKGDTEVERKTVYSPWTFEFKDVPMNENGSKINYTVDEVDVPEYSKSVNGTTITNTRDSELISIPVKKVWEDNNDQDGIRPDEIKVTLYANWVDVGNITLTKDNNYEGTFTGFPMYKGGSQIAYTIKEEPVNGYTSEISGNRIDGFVITNTHEPGKTSFSGRKVWEDYNDQDGIRPESLTIHLLADGEKVASKEITKDDWTYSFTDLPLAKDGEIIKYSVTEDETPGYEMTVDGNNLINTHTPDLITIKGVKVWDDNDNQDGKRPETVTINLLANGEKIDSKEVISEFEFTDLPGFYNGEEIKYVITEDAVPEYLSEIELTDDGYIVTNSYTPGKTEITVNKVWVDDDDKDELRPESVKVALLANGEKVGEGEITSETLVVTFTNLPIYESGTEIVYTVEELDIPEGYEAAVTGNKTEGFTITNTHEVVPTGSVRVKHVTEDGEILKDFEYILENEEEGTPYYASEEEFDGYELVMVSPDYASPEGEVIKDTTLDVVYVYRKIPTPEPIPDPVDPVKEYADYMDENTPVYPGKTIEYKLTWANNEGSEKVVMLKDTLSKGLTYVRASVEPTSITETDEGTVVIWVLGVKDKYSSGFITYQAEVNDETKDYEVNNDYMTYVGDIEDPEEAEFVKVNSLSNPLPGFELEKTRITEKTTDKGFIRGDKVTYDVIVTNVGKVALDMTITDSFNEEGNFEGLKITNVTKGEVQRIDDVTVRIHTEPGDVITVTYEADIAKNAKVSLDGHINTARATDITMTYKDKDGKEVTLTSDDTDLLKDMEATEYTPVRDFSPSYVLTKERVTDAPAKDKKFGFLKGDKVTYLVTIDNTGDLDLEMTVEDTFNIPEYFEGLKITDVSGTIVERISDTKVRVSVPAGEKVVITYEATIGDAKEYLADTAKDDPSNIDDGYVNTVKVTDVVGTYTLPNGEKITFTKDDYAGIEGKETIANTPVQVKTPEKVVKVATNNPKTGDTETIYGIGLLVMMTALLSLLIARRKLS